MYLQAYEAAGLPPATSPRRKTKHTQRIDDFVSDSPAILVVEDDRQIRDVLRQSFLAEGFNVEEAADEASMMRALETKRISLITLDLSLGRKDGLELAREIRAVRNIPIVMITGRSEPMDRVVGLEHGADDYIAKPFHIREVVLRIKSVLKRYGLLDDQRAFIETCSRRYEFHTFVLDAAKRELRSADGAVVELTETELRLLELFVRNPARVVSRDEIWQMLRGHDWSPLDRAIDGHVARLRRKIESPTEEEPRMIKSVRGVGYVFTEEVRRFAS